MRNLLGKIKIITDNVKILHRNVIGMEWPYVHPNLADYYEKLTDMEDDVAEMLILLGESDMNMSEAVNVYNSINVKKYTSREAYIITQHFFDDLIKHAMECRDSIPADCQSKLDEYVFWLRKEAYYKLNALLS